MTEKGVVFYDVEKNLNINEEYMDMPREITEVPSRELGEYLNAHTQRKMYYRTLLGRVEMLLAEAQKVYYNASSEAYKKYSASKMSETAKDRIIQTEVGEAYEKYAEQLRRKMMLNLAIENEVDAIFNFSREVSRRTGDFKNERDL